MCTLYLQCVSVFGCAFSLCSIFFSKYYSCVVKLSKICSSFAFVLSICQGHHTNTKKTQQNITCHQSTVSLKWSIYMLVKEKLCWALLCTASVVSQKYSLDYQVYKTQRCLSGINCSYSPIHPPFHSLSQTLSSAIWEIDKGILAALL